MSETMPAAKDRQLQIEDYLALGKAEPCDKQEVSTIALNNEKDESDIEQPKILLEMICDHSNMALACKHVVANKGIGGIDGMSVDGLPDWLNDNYEYLKDRLLKGKFKPKPVKRVEIPKKEKGKVRQLGIPTVVDRMVQQAIVQVLTPLFEPKFSDSSFGFRPNRGAHDALRQIKNFADRGNKWVASIDLEKFFDKVNQSKIVQLLADNISDGRVISLIHRYLMAGVMVDGGVVSSKVGTPQGGPLSPLLANIMLNELDKELEKRGHNFVRYADDCMVLKTSRKAAQRTMESISKFIEKKLFLKVNKEKSYVALIVDNVKYLGYGFYQADDEIRFRVHPKSLNSLKDKVRLILSRSNGWSLDYRRLRLKYVVYGWVNYFKLADMKSVLGRLDEWVRRKIRCVYWKCWKKTITKYRALIRLGASRQKAYEWANSRKSYWRIALSWILTSTLNNRKLAELGWVSFTKRYNDVRC